MSRRGVPPVDRGPPSRPANLDVFMCLFLYVFPLHRLSLFVRTAWCLWFPSICSCRGKQVSSSLSSSYSSSSSLVLSSLPSFVKWCLSRQAWWTGLLLCWFGEPGLGHHLLCDTSTKTEPWVWFRRSRSRSSDSHHDLPTRVCKYRVRETSSNIQKLGLFACIYAHFRLTVYVWKTFSYLWWTLIYRPAGATASCSLPEHPSWPFLDLSLREHSSGFVGGGGGGGAAKWALRYKTQWVFSQHVTSSCQSPEKCSSSTSLFSKR